MSDALRVVPAERSHHAEFARFFAGLELDDPVPDVGRWAVEMAPTTFFLAEDAHLVGYAYFEVFGELGYVRHVVVAAGSRGRGIGRALMRELGRRFRAAGASRWELNVKRGNHAGVALYERCGMRTLYATDVVRLDWDALPRLAGTARPVFAMVVEPEHDRDVERAFGLPEGIVARQRGFEGNVVAQLVEGGRPVAYARFNPDFPGCFPFRTSAPELARPMLEFLRPFARPADAGLQLVIEDDVATAEALLAAGARTVHEILHIGGAIPSDL